MENEKKLTKREQMDIICTKIRELQSEIEKKQKLLTKQTLKKYLAWLFVLITLLGSGYLMGKNNSQKKQIEEELNAQLANANEKIEALIDKYERYRLVDVFVFTTTYNDGRVEKELVTYDQYTLPGLTCVNLGKDVFSDYNILYGFNYFGDETLFFSVKNDRMCGNMLKIYTHDNENSELTGKYTQITFNDKTQIRKIIKDGDTTMISIIKMMVLSLKLKN